ncbi:right-handed parallel beta-helix repeat-containing protein [Microbacterium sp. LWH12-1.2]|uniref:right-handed parallel beta-helix repeat-containing protein n=1 Tax=Microbacterium sp. LWH12-1.2 TaxID=3135259 RepID=UPI0034184C1A
MANRLVAVDDADYRLPEPVINALTTTLGGTFVASIIMVGAGIDTTGVADSTTAIQNLLNAAPSGSTVHFPAGHYKLTDALVASKPLTITGFGARITQSVGGKAGLEITSSDVTVRGIRFTGAQFASLVSGERAIYPHGSTSAAPIENVTIEQCVFDTWGQGALWAQYCDDIQVTRCVAYDIRYAGLMFLSCTDGKVTKNKISNVTATPNAYGIAVSHLEVGTLADNPRSTDFVIEGNAIDGVPFWEGIDTHSGERITIANNTVRNAMIGIAAVGSGWGGNKYGPHDVQIVSNTITHPSTSGSGGSGILFAGENTSTGVSADAATGSIIGNTVRGMGVDTFGLGGIRFNDTVGLVVTGNTIVEPTREGISIYHDNRGFVVTGNTIVDPWTSTAGRAVGVFVQSSHNYGVVIGNHVRRESKTATNVLNYGVEVTNVTPNTITMLGNDWSAGVDGTILDSGNITAVSFDASLVTVGKTGEKVGFWGVTPVVRPTAYTQTYSTASKTHAAYTANDKSAAFTATPAALGDAATLADLNALRVAVENLRLHHESTAKVVNSVVDDLQATGLVQ